MTNFFNTPVVNKVLNFVRRTEPTPTVVFDTYWRFACERQRVYHSRVRGERGPWTTDPIISSYKFTNAYRASDRVSQYLIQRVIYASSRSLRDTFLRVLLFKLFNKIATWSLMEEAIGEIAEKNFSIARLDRVLTFAMNGGASIYSAAYIMPSGPQSIRQDKKHRMHLELLSEMLRDDLPERLAEAPTMDAAYKLLREVPSFGPFLAYQFVTDLNYSDHFDYSEMEFVVPGPGARDGLRKCFSDLGDYSEADTIRWVTERQEDEIKCRGLRFESLWGRPLQLIDAQNVFCEIDKYARVAHPEISGFSGRTRIKQKFAPNHSSPLPPRFPPKWGINERVDAALSVDRPVTVVGQRPRFRIQDEPSTAILL